MDQDTCCGLAAAVVSIIAFGSFAVPIKCQAARKVPVDPLGTCAEGEDRSGFPAWWKIRLIWEIHCLILTIPCLFVCHSLANLQGWHVFLDELAGSMVGH